MEEYVKVILRDNITRQSYYLSLTMEQYRLLNWLSDENLIDSVEIEVYEEYSFEPI